MFSPKAHEVIDYIIAYLGDLTNDWFVIKTHIFLRSHNRERKLLSRRSQSNRKQVINSYEREIINYWESVTGETIWINPDKLQADDWVRKRRGESLKAINEERKQKKRERLEQEAREETRRIKKARKNRKLSGV